MKYVKTFEQYSVINEEEILGLGKLFNKASATEVDLSKTDDVKLADAVKKYLDSTYEVGKITKSSRWEIIKNSRKSITESGVPAELVDKLLAVIVMIQKGLPLFTFDPKVAETEQKGHLLSYNKESNMLKFTPASEKTVNPNG
jgi:hypothetical protein